MSTTISEGFGTAPVFFTAISTILGAILFLRFGFAVSMLGFHGEMIKNAGVEMFNGYDKIGDVLFVNSAQQKIIE